MPPPPPPPPPPPRGPLAGPVQRTVPLPRPPPSPFPASSNVSSLHRQSRNSVRPHARLPLPPAPEFAPRLPSTPRMSKENAAPLEHPQFPSFTMGSDFFPTGDADDLHDITNVSQRSTSHVVNSNQRKQDMYSMPRPWDKPLDTEQMTSAAPISTVKRQQSRPRGKGNNNAASSYHDDDVHDEDIDEDDEDEDLDDLCDIPTRLTIGPGAAAARLDLQRCTLRVHKQLVNQLQTHSMKPGTFPNAGLDKFGNNQENLENDSGDGLSRAQGELFLKSRFPMRRWRRRYGSIVDHAYFGPVLFMFKYDAKGDVSLHHSMMIVLVDSEVRLGKNSTTKEGGYRCEFQLKTTRRKYQVAANHTMRRDYWIRNLEQIQATAVSRA